jgi:hypothetical protein
VESSDLQPSRDGALVDLVDRILVKGVILQADVIISVSGVPLIGVNLKAAIAGLTTMVEYGMMTPWDEQIRRAVLAESSEEAPLIANEEIVLKTFGSYRSQDKVGPVVWRSGYLYLTNKRLFLFRKKPAELIFAIDLDKVNSLSVDVNQRSNENRVLRVLVKNTSYLDAKVTLLRTIDAEILQSKFEEKVAAESEKVLVPVS